MVRVRTVWVGGGWIMGVRRKERRPGRETYPRGPAWDRKCQHPAPRTHIQFLLRLRGETRQPLAVPRSYR